MWYFICFEETILSWIHDRFMWMMNEIFHAMYESKEIRLCWGIHVSTETHGKVLNIIACLDSDIHEVTNQVIEGYYIWVFNLFWIFSNKRCGNEECLFKVCVHWKRWFMKLYFIFCCCYPIFLNNVFDDIICLESIMITYSF